MNKGKDKCTALPCTYCMGRCHKKIVMYMGIKMKKLKTKSMLVAILAGSLVGNQLPANPAYAVYATQKKEQVRSQSVIKAEVPTPSAITPVATPEASLIGIEVKAVPAQSTYMLGEAFDLEGLQLEGIYEDGSRQTVTPDSVSEIGPNLGVQTMKVGYQGFQVEFLITVIPATPAAITASTYSATALTLEWEEGKGATEYEIYQYNSKTEAYELVHTTDDLLFELEDLKSATPYQFKIKSIGYLEDGTRIESPFTEVFTKITKPTKVKNAAVEKNTASEISLTWSAVTRADGYYIYRYNKTKEKYEVVGTSKTTSYTDTAVTSGTSYKYKIKAYAGIAENIGAYSDLVRTGTLPAQVKITKIKNGEEKVRLTWDKVTGADGYRVYLATGAGLEYKQISEIEGKSNVNYVAEGLTTQETYYFKVSAYKSIASVVTEGALSVTMEHQVEKISKTSTAAKLYSSWTKFKKSNAYKNYKQFSSNVKSSKSYIIPGMKVTNVDGFNSTAMCPQGLCFAKKYMLVSAYDRAGEEKSVIYVLEKSTRKYVTTLVLSNKTHAGGLAFDGENIWVSNGSKVSSIPYSEVLAAVKSGKAYKRVTYQSTCAVNTKPSFMTYYDGKLWVGEYNESASKNFFSYTITKTEDNTYQLTEVNRMLVPSRTQGATFLADGTLILSRSCQTKTYYKVYISRLEVYKPSKPTVTGFIYKNAMVSTKTMPPMTEGIATNGTYVYVAFESSAFTECSYPVDRVCAFKASKIVKK